MQNTSTLLDSLFAADDSINCQSWTSLGLSACVAKHLMHQNLTSPTKIQSESIKKQIRNENSSQIIVSETGSGKTLAFLLPIVNKVVANLKKTEENKRQNDEINSKNKNINDNVGKNNKNNENNTTDINFDNDVDLLDDDNQHTKLDEENPRFQSAFNQIILSPTHELAAQLFNVINTVFTDFQKVFRISTILIGGMSEQKQLRLLKGMPQIIFATPGRANELMTDQMLKNVQRVVIDEADHMLEKGQFQDLIKLTKRITTLKQQDDACNIVLCSATLTLPSQLKEHKLLFQDTENTSDKKEHKTYIQNIFQKDKKMNAPPTLKFSHDNWTPIQKQYLSLIYGLGFRNLQIDLIDISQQKVINQAIQEFWHFCESDEEKQLIMAYLILNTQVSTLVFCSNARECKNFAECFKMIGVNAKSLHSNQKQKRRLDNVEQLQNKQQNCVIFTTDVCARGLDSQNIKLVIQFAKPVSPSVHVHRIGRCARQESVQSVKANDDNIKKIGVAVSLIGPTDDEDYQVISKMCDFTKDKIPQHINITSDLFNSLAHIMNGASQVVDCESEAKDMLFQFKRAEKQSSLEDENSEIDQGEVKKSTLEAVADMMNDMRKRKEMQLGKYYQQIKKQNVDVEDIQQMIDKLVQESNYNRRQLRLEVQKFQLKQKQNQSVGADFGIVKFEPRQIAMPDAVCAQFVVSERKQQKQEERQKEKDIKHEILKLKEQQQQKSKLKLRQTQTATEPVIITDVKIVDPLAVLARNTVEDEKDKTNVSKNQQQKFDDLVFKEEKNIKRSNSERAKISSGQFSKLLKNLGDEVDNDFMMQGPKEQRVKKLKGIIKVKQGVGKKDAE